MRVAGHERIYSCFGSLHQADLQLTQGIYQVVVGAHAPEAEVRGDLIVAAAPGMQLAADIADDFG